MLKWILSVMGQNKNAVKMRLVGIVVESLGDGNNEENKS